MNSYEGTTLHLIANRKENLYTSLIHSPNLILSLSNKDLLDYKLADILQLLLMFSDFQDTSPIKKFTELVSPEQLRDINPVQLACTSQNSAALKFFIDYNGQDLLRSNAENWPNVIAGICQNFLDNLEKLKLLELVFKNNNSDTRQGLLFPGSDVNILNYVWSTRSEEIIILINTLMNIPLFLNMVTS